MKLNFEANLFLWWSCVQNYFKTPAKLVSSLLEQMGFFFLPLLHFFGTLFMISPSFSCLSPNHVSCELHSYATILQQWFTFDGSVHCQCRKQCDAHAKQQSQGGLSFKVPCADSDFFVILLNWPFCLLPKQNNSRSLNIFKVLCMKMKTIKKEHIYCKFYFQ